MRCAEPDTQHARRQAKAARALTKTVKSLHQKFDVLVVAGAMAAGVAGSAQARVLARSVLEITNFPFFNGPPLGRPLRLANLARSPAGVWTRGQDLGLAQR